MTMRKRSVAASSEDRVYINSRNAALVDLLTDKPRVILDVGCGAGDNALLIKRRHPDAKIYGITRSRSEAALAVMHMTACWVADLEQKLPPETARANVRCDYFLARAGAPARPCGSSEPRECNVAARWHVHHRSAERPRVGTASGIPHRPLRVRNRWNN